MALGICCQWVQERTKRNGEVVLENIINEQSLQLGAYKNGKYSRERILETYRNNVSEILRIIPVLNANKIKSFRLSSGIFPLFEFANHIARHDEQILRDLTIAGTEFKKAGIRVTCHPGQYTVLSSDKQSVVENAKKELEYHAWVFDQMGFDQTPYYAINIHGGKSDRSQQLIDVVKSLPNNVKNRLTLENDEKCYNVKELIQIHAATNVPVVFDSHHFTFNSDDFDFDYAYSACVDTWGNIVPLQHLSNSEIGTENGSFNERRSHSKLIRYVPEKQLNAIRNNLIDLDIEAKSKNIAVLKMREDFNVEI